MTFVRNLLFPCQKRIAEAMKRNEVAYREFENALKKKKRPKRAIKANQNALQA